MNVQIINTWLKKALGITRSALIGPPYLPAGSSVVGMLASSKFSAYFTLLKPPLSSGTLRGKWIVMKLSSFFVKNNKYFHSVKERAA